MSLLDTTSDAAADGITLSSGQRQFCALFAVDPLDPAYNVPLVLRLRGALDVAAMHRTWIELVARHEILRTAYDLSGRLPRGVLREADEVDFAVVHDHGGEVAALVGQHAAEPLDLTRAPLRIRLVELGPDDHLLIVVVHHIACDGPSQHIVLTELSTLYTAHRDGVASPLAPLPLQYRDHAELESTRADAAADLDFWRETLRDAPTTELPTDRPRGDRRTRHGATVPIPFGPDLAARVFEVARAGRTTPYVVALTAFQILLARHQHTDGDTADVVVGTSVSRRDRAQLDGMVGYLANTLVMRHRWRGGTFAELVGSCRGQVLDALDHAGTPFADVAALSAAGRRPFDVMLDLRQGEPPPLTLPGLSAELVPSTDGVARFDLTAHLHDSGDVLGGELEYSTELFDRSTARHLAERFAVLLDRLTRSPHVPVDHVDVHPDDERARLLVHGEQRTRPLFALTGDDAAIAVTDGVTDVTYGELDRQAHRVARWLGTQGVAPGDLVGVRLARTPHLLAALLGVWRAGAAYVPIDPAHPDARVREIVDVSGVGLVVDDETLAGIDGPDDPVEHRPDPQDPAYVMFTSGSTGRPKGVVVTHGGLANYLGWVLEAYAAAPGGAPFFSSIGFDLGVPNLFAPLLHGQTVRLIPDGFDTAALGDLLSAGAPYSFVKLTPGHLDLLTQQLTPEQARGFAGLVIAAGDEFPKRLVERWAELGGPPLAAEYGPTEITVGNSAQFDLAGTRTNLVPLGRPIPNTSMFVLDAALLPSPVGVVGEVYIGGDGVALGYLGRPGLTAERFLPDPYGAPGARLYRTGDLARVLPDGAVDFVGRSDHQVKVRGYRIELDEIEGALIEQPGVRDAVVAVRDDRLVAYLTGDPDVARLRGALAGRLPAYLLPAAYVTLPAIPLTANGKVDRAGLPAPSRAEFVSDDLVAPDGVVETRIAQLWAKALDIAQIGANDSFFELGGDSVSAVALAGDLRAAGFDLSVADVFAAHTVRDLAALVEQRDRPAPSWEPVAPFALLGDADRAALPDDVEDAYPIALTQRGMLLELLAGGPRNHYHNITVFRIRDAAPFDLPAFGRAVGRVVARHDVMRTTFDLTSFDEPLQLVHRTAELALGCTDVSGLDAEQTDRLLHEHCDRERAELFALDVAPLMRMHVFTATDCWWLAITECHPVLEGWSYHNQLMELLRDYGARHGSPATEPDPEVRFADFVAAERAALADPSDHDYWRAVLTEGTPAAVPAAWGDASTAPERYQVHVPLADLEPGLRELARVADVPYKSVLLAAHLQVLGSVCPARRFHAGVVCDARPELPGFDRVSGMYLNSVPFRHRRGAATWTDLVTRTFRTEIEMWPHRHFPMPAMPALVPGSPRPVDVLFHYLDFHQVDTELVDVAACIDDSPNEFRLVVGTPTPGRLTLASSTDVLTRDRADGLAGRYREVLAAMAADPLGAPDDLAPFGTDGWHGAPAPQAGLGPLLTGPPDSVAVIAGDTHHTVADVRQRADRVTGHLLARGIGTDDVVGILVDRDVDLVATVVGVLDAGAAYLPLDPAHPDERLRDLAATATHVLAADVHAARVPGAVPLSGAAAGTPRDAVRPRPDPDALAYVIPTSGTTAGPKPVAVTRRALATYLAHATEHYGHAPGGAAVLSSHAFDITVPSLFVPLLTGQPVLLPPPALDPADLGAWLAARAPLSFLEVTTSRLRLLVAQLGADAVRSLAPVLVAAGEAVDPGIVRALPGLRVEYGPTETTVGVCHGPAAVGVTHPLGRPVAGTVVRLLDDDLRPVPDGVVGEVYVAGASLARGYAGMPAATAERFVPDPYGDPGTRMYATGDLARIRSGELEFLGRRDDQAAWHGHRVEPAEIEGALLRDDRVGRAVVRVEADGPVAYVQSSADPDAVLAALRDRLPAHLVPRRVVCAAALNTTANGKLDRRRPVDPDPSADDRGPFRTPATDVEQALAGIWSALTGAGSVGRDDTLRGLGGSSLAVLQVIALAARIGLDVPRPLLRADAPLEAVAAATRRDP